MFNHVLRHLFLVQDNIIVVKNAFGFPVVNSIRNTRSLRSIWSWNLIWVSILRLDIVKLVEILNHWFVVNFSIFFLKFRGITHDLIILLSFRRDAIWLFSYRYHGNLNTLVYDFKESLNVNFIVPFLVLSEEVNSHVLESFLEEVLQLVFSYVTLTSVSHQISRFWTKWSQIFKR